jgi:calcium-dependent protein kinase
MGIIHRDLKPENILMQDDGNPDTIKIIDFGAAKMFDISEDLQQKERIGTPFYIAPEVLNHNYNEKCDIWSIGVITFMLLSGKLPFGGKDDEQTF